MVMMLLCFTNMTTNAPLSYACFHIQNATDAKEAKDPA